MDIYLIACFIFAFLSLVKLAIVKYMHIKVNKRKQRLQAASASLIHLPTFLEDLVETAALTNITTAVPSQNNNNDDTISQQAGGATPRPRNSGVPLLRAATSAPIPPPPSQAYRDRYWRVMRAFHVGSQLVLPLAFVAFGIFYFFIYPSLYANNGVCN